MILPHDSNLRRMDFSERRAIFSASSVESRLFEIGSNLAWLCFHSARLQATGARKYHKHAPTMSEDGDWLSQETRYYDPVDTSSAGAHVIQKLFAPIVSKETIPLFGTRGTCPKLTY